MKNGAPKLNAGRLLPLVREFLKLPPGWTEARTVTCLRCLVKRYGFDETADAIRGLGILKRGTAVSLAYLLSHDRAPFDAARITWRRHDNGKRTALPPSVKAILREMIR